MKELRAGTAPFLKSKTEEIESGLIGIDTSGIGIST
jgi:hypothetical protein